MQEKTTKDFKFARFFLDIGLDIVIVVVLVLFIQNFIFAPFRIHGPSMCDTFNSFNGECYNGDGEFILVSRFPVWDLFGWSPTELERGDVIVFQAPYSEKGEYYIKRVIGLPGDTILVKNGLVYLKNEEGRFIEWDEPYLNAENTGNTHPHRSSAETYEVPEDSYFVMGDNRIKSSDSRRCFQQLGCSENSSPYLDESFIEGEVKLVLFPFTHFRWVSDLD
ncbi:signal peptidase I [Candidatus Peregrinibacteria bacterium]|nr:MAG: signal peptidase I [Candidatus Peregrinibacteria bacterium]